MNKIIYINQGASYSESFVTGVDLTGYTVASQIRKWYEAKDYDFMTVTITDEATGAITLSMSASQTSRLDTGRQVFDVLATLASGARVRILEGQAIVNPGLTGVTPPNATTTEDTELLVIPHGADYEHLIELRDASGSVKNLTGYTALMEIRPTADSPVLIMSLTDANGRLIIDPALGTIQIRLTAAETAGFRFDSAVYELDIISPTNQVTRVLGGSISLIY